MRKGALLLAMVAVATALEGKNGYVAAPVVALSEVSADITYGASFSGVHWQDMETFAPGPLARTTGLGEESAMAVDPSGEIFLLVYGYEASDNYTGVIAYDDGAARHVTQDRQPDGGVPWHYRAGGNMRSLVIAPVTAGRITSGHLLIVRTYRDLALYTPGGDSGTTHLEILDVDPRNGDRTLVHSWSCTVNANARVAVGDDGTLYVLQSGVLDTNGVPALGTIQKLSWNGSGYDDATLISGVEGGVLIGPDGDIYTFEDHGGRGWSFADGTPPQLLRVNPVSGAAVDHAKVDGRSFIHDWAFDSSGTLWMALDDGRRQSLSRVIAGETVSARKNSVAAWSFDFANVVAGDDNRLYVAEALFGLDAEVWTLDLDSGSDGRGGGKGKNK